MLCPLAHNLADYAVFAHPDFDPNDYANAILAGEPYPPQPGKPKPAKSTGLAPASEDVSVAISKLTFSLDDVEKQLKNVVSIPPPYWHLTLRGSGCGNSLMTLSLRYRSPHTMRIFSCKLLESRTSRVHSGLFGPA